MVRVKILPHKTPDVALVEFETATQACIARNHLDQVQMKGKSNIVLPQVWANLCNQVPSLSLSRWRTVTLLYVFMFQT